MELGFSDGPQRKQEPFLPTEQLFCFCFLSQRANTLLTPESIITDRRVHPRPHSEAEEIYLFQRGIKRPQAWTFPARARCDYIALHFPPPLRAFCIHLCRLWTTV